MNPFKGSSIFVFIATSFFITLNATSKTLPLDQYLLLLKENDPEYKSLILEKKKSEFYVDENLKSRSTILTTKSESGFDSNSSNSKEISTSISKEILETGTTLSATHNITDEPDRDETVTQFRIEQSLLKNFLGKSLRLKKNSLEMTKKSFELTAEEDIELYLRNKLYLYLDFAHATYDLQLARQLHRETKKLYKFVQDKFKKNAANHTDLNRVSLQIILREEALLKKEVEFDGLKKNIIATTGINSPAIEVEHELLLNKIFPFQVDEFIPGNYRQYAIADYDRSSSLIEKELAERDSYPSLSLLAGYDLDNSTRFSSTVDSRESILGFKLIASFGDSKTNAISSIANLDFQKKESARIKTETELKLAYYNFKRRLEETEKKLQLSQKKVALMKDILKEDTRRYRMGKLDLDKIIEINNDFAQYQFQYSQDRVEFNKVYTDWLAFNDQLIKYNLEDSP